MSRMCSWADLGEASMPMALGVYLGCRLFSKTAVNGVVSQKHGSSMQLRAPLSHQLVSLHPATTRWPVERLSPSSTSYVGTSSSFEGLTTQVLRCRFPSWFARRRPVRTPCVRQGVTPLGYAMAVGSPAWIILAVIDSTVRSVLQYHDPAFVSGHSLEGVTHPGERVVARALEIRVVQGCTGMSCLSGASFFPTWRRGVVLGDQPVRSKFGLISM